jgi:decaprenyl-phosphate phosphoribosyltransferase
MQQILAGHWFIMYRNIVGLIGLIRPKQWVKNCFVLAPLLFTSEFLNSKSIYSALFTFFLFCLASSTVYIINDIHDMDHDRLHPKKSKNKPLASGAISIPMALGFLIILYAILIICGFFMPNVMLAITFYLLINIAYTFKLKQKPVLDIFCISLGFVLRVYAGAIALNVPLSGWMFVTTFCLALYLSSIKRRQELIQYKGESGRESLKKYSIALINRYAELSATAALIFYSLFIMSSQPQLLITIPIVLFGLFRYWYVVEQLDEGESPTDALFSDKQLLLTVVIWVTVCAGFLWPHG